MSESFLPVHRTQGGSTPASSVLPLPMGANAPWLAPLASHSDLAFRIICRECGAAVAFTEMVSAKGLIYGLAAGKKAQMNSGTEELLYTTPIQGFPAMAQADSPLVVQLFAEEADFLGQATGYLKERGFVWFDLNMGCSVPKVVRNGAGAAMMRNLDNALEAAKLMIKQAGLGRVGFKFRLGWTAAEENYLELAQELEKLGAGWLTLHPRYARQGFSGTANWKALSKLVQSVKIPVIASGDLLSAQAAALCHKETGVQGVMFARGAISNPFIFAEYTALMQGLPEHQALRHDKKDELEKLITRHIELAKAMPVRARRERAERKSMAPTGLLKMRGAIPRYLKTLPGSRALRTGLATSKSWEEFEGLLTEFFRKG